MTNTRQLMQIDEEALIPKRVKRKKKSDIENILQGIKRTGAYLNAFLRALKTSNTTPFILNTDHTQEILPLLDMRSLRAYASTSRQAYVNAYSHEICKHRLFALSAQQKINEAQKRIVRAQHHAELATKTTTIQNNRGRYLTSAIAFIAVGGSLLAAILIMEGLHNDISSESSSQSNEKNLGYFAAFSMVAGCFATGLCLYYLITNKAYNLIANHFNNRKKEHEEYTESLNELTEALENNNFSLFHEKLDEYIDNEDSLTMDVEMETQPTNESTRFSRN